MHYIRGEKAGTVEPLGHVHFNKPNPYGESHHDHSPSRERHYRPPPGARPRPDRRSSRANLCERLKKDAHRAAASPFRLMAAAVIKD